MAATTASTASAFTALATTSTSSSILSRQESLNHSGSQTKLERKVSFHTSSGEDFFPPKPWILCEVATIIFIRYLMLIGGRNGIIGIFVFTVLEQDRPVSKLERMDSQRTASAMSSDSQASGKDKKEKKKKDKEKDPEKEARREERRKRKEKKRADKASKEQQQQQQLLKTDPSCGDLLTQVSEKLKLLEMEQLRDDSDQEEDVGSLQQLSQLPPSSLLPGIMSQQQPVPTATASLQQQHDVALKATVSLGSNGNCLGVSTVSAVSPEPQTQVLYHHSSVFDVSRRISRHFHSKNIKWYCLVFVCLARLQSPPLMVRVQCSPD